MVPLRSASPLARTLAAAGAAAAVATLVGCSTPTPDARSITVTFVRAAQSQIGEAVLDTAVPGPGLTPAGEREARELAGRLQGNDYDAVYASTMQRAQQTAAPLARTLGEQVEVLPGIEDIGAGTLEGKPEAMAGPTYLIAPTAWVAGDREATVPGSIDGTEFADRFGGAVQQVYDADHSRPVVFGSGTSIMAWTLMNVVNPKLSLFSTHPVPEGGRVVISGNPVTGWQLVNWDGITDFAV